jgi:probable HAF family extracellular repeat protein
MRFLPCLFVGLLLGGSFHLSADILYSVTDLGDLGGPYSYGWAINNAGQVTGWSFTATSDSVSHAFLYSNGQMTDLGALVHKSLLCGFFREDGRIGIGPLAEATPCPLPPTPHGTISSPKHDTE